MKKNSKKVYRDWSRKDIEDFFIKTPNATALIIPNGDGTNTVIEKNVPNSS